MADLETLANELRTAAARDPPASVTAAVRRWAQDEAAGPRFLSLVEAAAPVTETVPLVPVAGLTEAFAVADQWIAGERDRRETSLQTANDATINSQLESLRLTHERQRFFLHTQLQEQRDESILRMRRAQLNNSEVAYEQKTVQLEAHRGVGVGRRLIAAGVLVNERPPR